MKKTHAGNDPRTHELLCEILCLVKALTNQGERIMATLQQVADDVAGEKSVIEGISTLIDGLETQLEAALAGATISPAVQAQIDAIFQGAEDNKTALAAALLKGTKPVVPVEVPPIVT